MALYDTTKTSASQRPYGRVVSTCILTGLLLGTRWRSGFFDGGVVSLNRLAEIGLVDQPSNVIAQETLAVEEQAQLQAELLRIKAQIGSTGEGSGSASNVEEQVVINSQPSPSPAPSTSSSQSSPTIVQTSSGTPIYSFESLFGQGGEGIVESTVVPLSGTFERSGILKSAVDVGVEKNIQYIQKTIYNDHFAYLGSFDAALLPKVLDQGGSIVQVEDAQSILDEGLFGDRVWLIQGLETWEQKDKTLMIVFFDQARNGAGDARYMQFDNDHYATIKEELPTLFAQRYSW